MSVLTNPAIISYIDQKIQDPMFAGVWTPARDEFAAGKPGNLARLLRLELSIYEQVADKPVPVQEICSGPERGRAVMQTKIREIYDMLENIAALYGNHLVWGSERERRELEQSVRIREYVSVKILENTDSGD